MCLLASGWPELQPLSWLVVAGSGGQQMKPAALVLLDCRHTMALLSLVGRQAQELEMDQAFNTLSGSARLQGTGDCFDSDDF